MTAVNVYDAKTHLSRLLRRVRAGEEIIIADNGEPVARLVPFRSAEGSRALGGDEGQVWMADDFNAPLPDDVLAGFYGELGGAKAIPPLRAAESVLPWPSPSALGEGKAVVDMKPAVDTKYSTRTKAPSRAKAAPATKARKTR